MKKLRKKLTLILLAAAAAVSVSGSVVSAYQDVSDQNFSFNQYNMYVTNRRYKYNDSYVYLKLSSVNNNDGKIEVEVDARNSATNHYTMVNVMRSDSYNGGLCAVLGKGQYLITNWAYERYPIFTNNGYRCAEIQLVFSHNSEWECNATGAWSPDSIGSYTIVKA